MYNWNVSRRISRTALCGEGFVWWGGGSVEEHQEQLDTREADEASVSYERDPGRGIGVERRKAELSFLFGDPALHRESLDVEVFEHVNTCGREGEW